MSINEIINTFLEENPDFNIDETIINLEEIIDDAHNKTPYFIDKTLKTINEELWNELEQNDEIYNKLKDNYYLIRDHNQLQKSRYIRWLKLTYNNNEEEKLYLAIGGLVINIYENENNTQILVLPLNAKNKKAFKLNFYDTLVFQKMSPIEKLILSTNNSLYP